MNTNASAPAGVPKLEADPRAEMIAYDMLDPRLRTFIAKAPDQLSCIWLLEMQRQHGVEAMLRSGAQMIRQRYPDWTPI